MLSMLRKICTSTPFLVLMLLVWGLALAAGVGFYALKERPDLLRRYVLETVSEQLPDLVLSVNEMTPVLWPSPGVRLTEVLLRERDTENGSAVFAKACTLHFRWGELLTGNVSPGRVALETPDVFIRLRVDALRKPAEPVVPGEPAPLPVPQVLAALASLNGLTLEISSGKVLVQELRDHASNTPENQQKAPIHIRISDLSGSLTAPSGEAAGMLGLNPGAATLSWAVLEAKGFGQDLTINAGQLEVSDVRLSRGALVRTGSVDFTARISVDNLLRDMDTSLTGALAMTAGPPDLRGELSVGGTALINEVPVAVQGKFPFSSRDVRQSVDIRSAQLAMEDNKATLTATWLPDDNSLTGRVDVTRLSLPRWFAFGRKLPAGLVSSLDDISGVLTFRMTRHSLVAPEMLFTVRGVQFKGNGGVSDFTAPVIRIEAATGSTDINRIFPELVNPEQAEPNFSAPPLLDGKSSAPDVGFDIRLKADDAVFWRLIGRNFELHLAPVWNKPVSGTATPSSIEGTQINVSWKQFYGGEAAFTLLAGDEFRLNARLRNVRGEGLSSAFVTAPAPATTAASATVSASRNTPQAPPAAKVVPQFGGTLNAIADLRGRGSTLAAVIAGLTGSVDATLSGGFFGPNKTRFASLRLKAENLHGLPASALLKLPPELPYNARWQVALTAPREPDKDPAETLAFTAESTGRLQFSTSAWRPVSATGIPFKATGRMQSLPFNINGRFSMNSAAETMNLANVSGRFAASDVSFNLNGTDLGRSARWKGQGTLAASNLRELLASVELLPPRLAPDVLRRGDVRGNLELSDGGFRLDSLQGTVDDTSFKGSLARADKQNKHHWDVNLQLANLDADAYLGKKDNERKNTPWNLSFLRENSMAGEIRVDRLTLLDMYYDNFRLPLRLVNGEFTATPMSARAAGGTFSAMFRAAPVNDANNALRLALQAGLEGANLHTLRREVSKGGSKDMLAGTGAFQLDLTGEARSFGDIPANLNGTWGMKVDNGYFQSGTSRRFFTFMTASGTMRSGVLQSSDLFVNGNKFTVRGGGSVNLVNNTLDYRLNASLPGVPNIPITYSGSISDPKRNINALSTLGGVFANVGKGLFSIVDQVITAPFRFLQ